MRPKTVPQLREEGALNPQKSVCTDGSPADKAGTVGGTPEDGRVARGTFPRRSKAKSKNTGFCGRAALATKCPLLNANPKWTLGPC